VLIRDPMQIFKTQALMYGRNISAGQIVSWFVRRWQVKVTFHEVRSHLGVKTQKKWADLSILRLTPALFGLFSVISMLAQKQQQPIQKTAWYAKKLPTFSDALGIVKQTLFVQHHFLLLHFHYEIRKVPRLRSKYHFLAILALFHRYILDKVQLSFKAM
jgi:hypothetical protein